MLGEGFLYLLAEFVGVGVGEMVVPTGERSLDTFEMETIFLIQHFPILNAGSGTAKIAIVDANVGGENAEADEVTTDAGFKDLAFDGVDFEVEFGLEVGFDRFSMAVEFISIVAEEGEVIDVAEIACGF